MKKSYLLAVLIVLAIAGIAAWKLSRPATAPAPVPPENGETPNVGSDKGVVTPGPSGKLLYTNEKSGFSFTFPESWHIGQDSLTYTSFQIFNYDETQENGSKWREGMNKIEAGISDKNSSTPSSDYPEKSRESATVQIGGVSVVREDVELEGLGQHRTYYMPFPDQHAKFLRITIYGDKDNFSVFDDLVKSLSWVE